MPWTALSEIDSCLAFPWPISSSKHTALGAGSCIIVQHLDIYIYKQQLLVPE